MFWAFMGLFDCLDWKRLRFWKREIEEAEETEEESWSLFFHLRILEAATDNFSVENRLGSGGFGPVFKGRLSNGQEIAVKKLAVSSRQGAREFTNEVKLLLKVQHRNLVTLLGCCYEGGEKMLVYEYLPNKSLDNFLFDKSKGPMLNWSKRLEIIKGIAKGLLYLHEESPVRIIHRDIKASNILLDEKLDSKISDFGMARFFPGEETHLDTFRIAGTPGYVAPEYALYGRLSVKTDVFSFGVLVLEVVSGRKNHDPQLIEDSGDLLSYTWRLYQEGRALEVVDQILEEWSHDEVAMCIQIGLLCCQANVAERPDMFNVVLMLSSDSFTLPKPGKPGILGRRGRWNESTGSSAPTYTNTNTTANTGSSTGITSKASNSTIVDDMSINSISVSFTTEGR